MRFEKKTTGWEGLKYHLNKWKRKLQSYKKGLP